jgi:hypothetical protein
MSRLPHFNVHHPLFRLYFGILAWAVFVLLRPGFDLAFYIKPKHDAETIRQKVLKIGQTFGHTGDSLAALVMRVDHAADWKHHQEEESLQQWASSGDLITGWVAVVTPKSRRFSTQGVDLKATFEQYGVLYIVMDDAGRVRELEVRKYDRNQFFIPQIAPKVVADSVFSLLGYPPVFWEDGGVTEPAVEIWNRDSTEVVQRDQPGSYALNPVLKAKTSTGLPVSIHLEKVQSLVEDSTGIRLAEGFQLASLHIGVSKIPAPPVELFSPRVMLYLTLYMVLLGFVVWAFFRRVLKQAIEWKRGTFIMLASTVLYAYWRIGYWVDVIIPGEANTSMAPFLFSELLNGVIFGAFGAMAYLAWESMAREDQAPQLPIVDAFWSGRVFYRESGKAILDGYAFAGMYLCLQALMIYGLNELAVPRDSQFGHAELLKAPYNLSLSSNALFFGFFTSTFLVGVAVQLFENLKVGGNVRHAITIGFLGLIFSGAGRVMENTGSIRYDLAVAFVTVPFVYTVYLRTGIVTLMTLFSVAFTGYHVLPFIQSGNDALFLQGLLTIGLGLIPLVFGLVALKYGNTVASVRKYRPKYVDEMEKQLRIANELRIAAESQYTLLPQQVPSIKGASVAGFFLPSQEVGGDFFDYVPRILPDGSDGLALVVADVSGKAMKAALQAVFTNGLILSRIRTDNPDELLTNVNALVHQRTDRKTFVTTLVANYNPLYRTLTYAAAGHCPPVLKRNGVSTFLPLDSQRLPLGVRANTQYAAKTIVLEPGDMVLFYSDGLPEAQTSANEQLGYEALLLFLNELPHTATAESVVSALRTALRDASRFTLHDDTTLVCLTIDQNS